MNGAIKKVFLVIATLALSIALFIFAVGTSGNDGALAFAVNTGIQTVNNNIEKVTGITKMVPYVGGGEGPVAPSATSKDGSQSGAGGVWK